MKHIVRGVGSIVACVTMLAASVSPAYAAVDDYTISNYQIDYVLSQDTERRSVLKTTERITAEFPQIDQNHGIERAIPTSYDQHPTSLSIDSVTDAAGAVQPYTTYESSGNEVLRIGDADTYVHGTRTYVITYTQRDVTKNFGDTGRDEWYWDTNGTGWRVPITQLDVSVRLDRSITLAQAGDPLCYQGGAGSTQRCSLVQQGESWTASAMGLAPGQNMTLAFGFTSGTFAGYAQSPIERALQIYQSAIWLSVPVVIGVSIWLVVRWVRVSGRRKERGTIVAEYLPPSDASVTTSAAIIGTQKVFAAQLIDLAVRHYLKIYETKAKSLWSYAKYDIEVIKDPSELRSEEQELLSDIFGHLPSVGERLALESLKNNFAASARLSDNSTKLAKLIRESYGLREKNDARRAWFRRAALVLVIIGVWLPPFLLASLIALVCALTLWPLTDKGLALSRYLEGLKLYIKVAEIERLRMLQSPEGAVKVGPVSADDPAQLVKLYERVLPYAILFGQEKQWNNQLGHYYESLQSQPDWYMGHNAAFNAALFSSAMTDFATAASYASPSESSSGGSSGGGSSGGGGGGGGGGGW